MLGKGGAVIDVRDTLLGTELVLRRLRGAAIRQVVFNPGITNFGRHNSDLKTIPSHPWTNPQRIEVLLWEPFRGTSFSIEGLVKYRFCNAPIYLREVFINT